MRTNRVAGLDAIRAVCAIWVVMGHFEPPPLTAGIDKSTLLGWVVSGIFNNLWNGPAAVVVFFVISGFCIHYPFSHSLRIPSILEYATRRYVRIGVPLAGAIALSPHFGVKLELFHDSILWSLAAELVYYTIYPALLVLHRQGISWSKIFVATFVAALLVAMDNPIAKNYPSYGLWLNWILGLPCWILGCLIAEQTANRTTSNTTSIWRWRGWVWTASAVCSVLRFHSPIGYPWSLNLFGILAGYWLRLEIFRYQNRKPWAFLEWMGTWSYSIYLVHVLAISALSRMELPNLGYGINWLVAMSFILACSYLFYLCLEYPGHLLARSLGRALGRTEAR